MAHYAFFTAVFLVSVSFIGYAQCKDPPLTEFGKKVKKLVPDKNLNKVFAVNYKSDDELAKAVEAGTRNLYEVVGVPFDEDTVKKTDEEDKALGKSKITPELIFHAFTYAIQMTFKELGILNDDNIDDLAKSFADEINKAAKNLNKDDIFSTFKAVTTAVGKFLKSQGVTTEDKLNLLNKYYIQEQQKYVDEGDEGDEEDGDSSFLGSLLGGLSDLLGQLFA